MEDGLEAIEKYKKQKDSSEPFDAVIFFTFDLRRFTKLITADVLKGRKITGWKSVVQDIKNAGAEFIDQEVVEDGNLISSRQPADLPAFIKASLRKLG